VRSYTWLASVATLTVIPFVLPTFLSVDHRLAFWFLGLMLFFNHMFLGPVLSMIQALAGIHRRTQAAAFYLFLANLVAMSLGPLIVGMVSDYYNESFTALRYTILILAVICSFWASIHFYLASRTLKTDLVTAQSPNTTN